MAGLGVVETPGPQQQDVMQRVELVGLGRKDAGLREHCPFVKAQELAAKVDRAAAQEEPRVSQRRAQQLAELAISREAERR